MFLAGVHDLNGLWEFYISSDYDLRQIEILNGKWGRGHINLAFQRMQLSFMC